ncbi:hypothetical protein BDW62DRAFT_212908 [Aspergillus aurantiobrunneus]
MAIVFGTRLAGPGRSSRYHPGSTSTWKNVNGVPIPPRPEEPDNCCMSGCVHCVWDDYRDEMEEWADMLAQAKSKSGPSKSPKVIPGAIQKTPVDTTSTSMDDDGGGSETNWSLPGPSDDLFADIPVGIREFMKTEKRLKEIHRQKDDIILNKANIALARSQRLVASWLPAQNTTNEIYVKSDSELQEKEDEIFTAVPETLGLGAPLPTKAADGSWNRIEIDSNDKLRKQLLGRNYKKVMTAKARQKTDAGSVSSVTKNPDPNRTGNHQRSSGVGDVGDNDDDDVDDDDEGRAASIGKKMSSRKRKAEGIAERPAQTQDANGKLENEYSEGPNQEKTANSQQPKPKERKKATSFLDEILTERSKKRKKR